MPDPATQPAMSGSALVRFAQKRPLTLFFVLAYLWTWSLWVLMARTVPDGDLPPGLEIYFETLFAAAAFGPTVAALATSWLVHRNLKICRVWTGWRSLLQGLMF